MLARCLTKHAKSCDIHLLEFALLAVSSVYGNGKEALNILDWMYEEVVEPNAVTFDGRLLACNCAGLVDEPHIVMVFMNAIYMISAKLELDTCKFVDLLDCVGHSRKQRI